MSTKTNNKQTLQERKTELVELLSGRIKGFSDDMLDSLEVQQLQDLADNLKVIKKTSSGSNRSNIAMDMVELFLNNKIEQMKVKEFHANIRMLNKDNYFTVKDETKTKVEIDTDVETISAWAVLGYLNSTEDDEDAVIRVDKWIKRAPNYANSHCIGTTQKSALKNSKKSKHYFIKEKGFYKLVEKE